MAETHQFGADNCMASSAPHTNRIADLRELRGWSRPQLANRMNTSPQQIERLEKGQRKLTQQWMERAAAALGVMAADLLPESGTPVLEIAASYKLTDPRREYRQGPMQADLPPIVSASMGDGPVGLRVLDLDLSMGDGSNLDDYVEEGLLEFDAGLLRSLTRSPPERLYLARGSGDSMFPTLVNGDMVLIDTLQCVLNLQDRLWAISLFGAGGIKRLQPVGQGLVEVISDNPMRDNRMVNTDDLRILGRVIWLGREV